MLAALQDVLGEVWHDEVSQDWLLRYQKGLVVVDRAVLVGVNELSLFNCTETVHEFFADELGAKLTHLHDLLFDHFVPLVKRDIKGLERLIIGNSKTPRPEMFVCIEKPEVVSQIIKLVELDSGELLQILLKVGFVHDEG